MKDEKKDCSNKTGLPESKTPGQAQAAGLAGYAIRFKDHLDTCWLDWFEGWSVTNLENGEVLLQSDQVDHSKLHGTLNKIMDLNLTLLSVMRTAEPGQGAAHEESRATKKNQGVTK